MGGIVFFNTINLNRIVTFYTDEIGMSIWLDLGDAVILRHRNLLLGFSEAKSVDNGCKIVFYYPTKEEVNEIYRRLRKRAHAEPTVFKRYSVYHFFANDPDGRLLEFQYFTEPVDQI